eukprot:TRINITY_DN5068_c0_g1_i10.p1 TRINITY_DN5068_c0_g1~~TRINITY_DN5068_c0_g1_i10.p1  ORF type:complete len:515 (-),score=85.65 TRINITY_DN5068_c0_g1_i10:537-2081(-)
MGSSNSRAGGGAAERPETRAGGRQRRRLHRGIRPFIRSLSCGTVFPRSHENEDLPSENGNRVPNNVEEGVQIREVSVVKSTHSCPDPAEYVRSGAAANMSGESSSNISRDSDTLMQSSDSVLNSRLMQETDLSLSVTSGRNDKASPTSNVNGCESILVGSETISTDTSHDLHANPTISSVQLSDPTAREPSAEPLSSEYDENLENLHADAQMASDSMQNQRISSSENSASEQLVRDPESSQAETSGTAHTEVANPSPEGSSGSEGHVSSQEARRNTRRRLWDALTRGSHRRRGFTPAILLSADIDDLSSSNERWLLDFSGLLYEDGFDEDGFFGGRTYDTDERRGRFRSQVWALQRLRRNSDSTSGHSRFCRFHADGHCSCEAYVMTEETSTHASISRIVMLAEALFESVALSQSTSLSLVSLPAPEAVVDSLPIRHHKVPERNGNTAEEEAQCYICLSEYEEGDKIRTLPCHHEYHMACVDKWLKEIHRVCPLCRGNVCENQSSVTTTSNSSA